MKTRKNCSLFMFKLSIRSNFCTNLNKEKSSGRKRKNSGRKTKVTSSQEEQIVEKCLSNPFLTAVDIYKSCTDFAYFSIHTLRSVLRKHNLFAFSPAVKPFLTDTHKSKRLEFAGEYLTKTSNFWRNVIFSDESYFRFANFKPTFVRRLPGTRYSDQNIFHRSNKSTANVMVWGAFSAYGYADLIRIDGKFKSQDYCSLLSTKSVA
jgi:hypothetical protein